jgi:hypothetical protein
MEHAVERKGKTITTIDTCTSCGHKEKDKFTLGENKKEKVDKDYAKDRDRFCLSEKEGQEYIQGKENIKAFSEIMDKWDEKDKYKEDYEAVEKLEKLTIVDLKKRLVPVCEKAG